MQDFLKALTKWAGYALALSGIVTMVPEVLKSVAALFTGAANLDLAAVAAAGIAIMSGVGLIWKAIQQQNADTARAMAVIARARALNEYADTAGKDRAISATAEGRDLGEAFRAVRELAL